MKQWAVERKGTKGILWFHHEGTQNLTRIMTYSVEGHSEQTLTLKGFLLNNSLSMRPLANWGTWVLSWLWQGPWHSAGPGFTVPICQASSWGYIIITPIPSRSFCYTTILQCFLKCPHSSHSKIAWHRTWKIQDLNRKKKKICHIWSQNLQWHEK